MPTNRLYSRFSAPAAAVLVLTACGDSTAPEMGDSDPPEGPQWGADVGTLVAMADRDRFVDAIEVLAAFGDRTQGSASNLAALDWIDAEFVSFGYEVERHDYTFQGQPRQNIYATKVGDTEPDGMYIVSAHMDGRGGGGGADDDASGVSLVLEIARVLGSPEVRTERSVRFILWNNEETGLNGSSEYVADRAPLRGIEDPPGSGLYPEPNWLGMIQHDMILFDHGLPPGDQQVASADVDVEYQSSSDRSLDSRELALLFRDANAEFVETYPAQVGTNMRNTDSWPFRNFAASISVRENQRVAEIGNGSNPHWHQPTDVFATYDDEDFDLGFAALGTTLAAVAHLAGASR